MTSENLQDLINDSISKFVDSNGGSDPKRLLIPRIIKSDLFMTKGFSVDDYNYYYNKIIVEICEGNKVIAVG